MSEISQEKGCGKATMYVITEKGLEIGPFVYGKKTDSRVLCTNTGHIYYSQRKESRIDTANLSTRRDPEEKRRLRIVDLGNSLPSESLAGGDSRLRQAVRDMEYCGLATGNLRASHAIKRSGKQRVNKDKDKCEYKLAEKSQMHLEMLKQALNDIEIDEQCIEMKKHEKEVLSDKKANEPSLIVSRQTELQKVKRKSEVLMEELAKWTEQNAGLNENGEVQTETDLKKRLKMLKGIFFSSRIKTANEGNVLPRLNLPSLKRISASQYKKKESNNNTMITKENSSTNINSKLNLSKLKFFNPNSQYSQVKAESTAKLNINQCKLSTVKPKVRLPSVIDQRTGEMHYVPGVVTYRPCDYNRWSRKRNIVRRKIIDSRSPLVTHVSVFPSISENKTLESQNSD